MFYVCYIAIQGLPELRWISRINIRSVTGNNLLSSGLEKYILKLGNKTFDHDIIVCKNLTKPIIIGKDMRKTV